MDVLTNKASGIDSPSKRAFYDDQLGSLLWSFSGPSSNRLLAVMTKAIRNGEPSNEVRRFLLDRFSGVPLKANRKGSNGAEALPVEDSNRATRNVSSEPDGSIEEMPNTTIASSMDLESFVDLVRAGPVWHELWRKAEGEVHRSNLDRRALVVRALYSGTLTPLPGTSGDGELTYKTAKALRVAMAVTAVTALTNGKNWDSIIMSRPRLGTITNWSLRVSGEHLNTLCNLGLLRRQSAVENKFRILDPLDKKRHASERHAASMAGLTNGEADRIATVLLSVTHPAWGYSRKLNHGHWLLLLANVAGIAPADLGFTAKNARPLQRTLDAEYLTPAHVLRHLGEILDLVANDPEQGTPDKTTGEQVSAIAAFQLADELREQAAAKRTAEVIAARSGNRQVHLEEQERRAAAKVEAPGKSRRRSERDDDDTTLAEGIGSGPRVLSALLRAWPVPSPPMNSDNNVAGEKAQRKKELREWLSRMRIAVAPEITTAEIERAYTEALQQEVRAAGFNATVTDDLIGYIVSAKQLHEALAKSIGLAS